MLNKNTPQETAQILLDEKFPIEQYQELQDRRNERLRLFKERKIQPLIDSEQELVNFGEEVLRIMKENQ